MFSNDYEDILFGYMCTPSCGWRGKDDGGFSVEVYEDCRLIHKTYIFDQIDKSVTEYKISENSVTAIKKLMKKNQKKIDILDKNINNGSYDGVGNQFVFNGKQIITWNIKTYESIITKFISFFSIKYHHVNRQESKVCSLFFKVSKILKSEGVNLNLYNVSFNITKEIIMKTL